MSGPKRTPIERNEWGFRDAYAERDEESDDEKPGWKWDGKACRWNAPCGCLMYECPADPLSTFPETLFCSLHAFKTDDHRELASMCREAFNPMRADEGVTLVVTMSWDAPYTLAPQLFLAAIEHTSTTMDKESATLAVAFGLSPHHAIGLLRGILTEGFKHRARAMWALARRIEGPV